MFRKYLSFIFILLIIFITIKCATRGRPSGGPVDKIPPEITYTFPSVDSIGVKYLNEIQIHFSERMDEGSAQKALFISPALDYEVYWSGGDELTLEISPDSLRANQTYVITIGAEAKDSRNNKMTSSFQFAFSTGNYLDQGEISGKIFELKNNDIMYIYAYELSGNDSIDPRYNSARFLTQSGEKGFFQLSYLPLNDYRIFVVEDQNRNFLLDAAYERIGIPTRDVRLDSSNMNINGLNFKLTQIDTTAPFITGARALFNNTIILRSSEELKELLKNNIEISDTLTGKKLNILGITESSQSSSQYLLYTDIQDSNAFYSLTVSDISDTNNNQQIEPSIVYFSGGEKKDTTSFELQTIQPPDSTKNFSIYSKVAAKFTLPIDTSSLNNAFNIIAEPDDTLSGIWDLKEFKEGDFRLLKDLKPGNDYRFILNTNLIKSVWRDTLKDTIYNHIFSTPSTDDFGSISGQAIIDSIGFSQLYLTALSLKNKKQSFKVVKSKKNKFKIDWLNEGYYIFKGFFDLNNDQKWSPGKLEPFQYAEPIFVNDDTIRVRKRWETSDLIIRFEE